jgi:hypothetical protein
MMPTKTCDIHGRALVRGSWCPACRGALGGQRRSRAKTLAVRANAQRPRSPRAGDWIALDVKQRLWTRRDMSRDTFTGTPRALRRQHPDARLWALDRRGRFVRVGGR